MSKRYRYVAKAELAYQLTQPLLYVFVVIVFLLAFHDITLTSPTASGLIRIGAVEHHSALVISRLLAVLGTLSIIAAPFIIAPALQRDIDHRIYEIVYSYPVTDGDLLWGRFTGALLSFLLISLAALAGTGIGNLTLEADGVGAFNGVAYLWAWLLIGLPGLLFSALVLYLVTVRTRKNSTIYLSAIILFLLYVLIPAFVGDLLRHAPPEAGPTLRWLTLLDPSGMAALDAISHGMTVAQKNEFSPIGTPFLLLHRGCWLLMSGGLGVWIHRSFLRTVSLGSTGKQRAGIPRGRIHPTAIEARRRKEQSVPSVSRGRTPVTTLRSLLRLSWIDFSDTVFNIGFILIALLSLSSLHSNFTKNVASSGVYPTTAFFINSGLDNVDPPLLLLLLFFSGVIVWKEKDYRFAAIYYSYPRSNAFIFLQKLFSLALIVILYVAIVFGFGVLTQILVFGYEEISFSAYRQYLVGHNLFNYLVVAAGFALLHVLSPSKFVGYGLSVLGMLWVLLSPSLGMESHLLRPGALPEVAYSQLNELNPVRTINGWYRIYWALFIGIAASFGILLWDRGEGLGLRQRWHRSNVKGRFFGLVLLSGFVAVGGFIAIRSGALRTVPTKWQTALAYEKKYRSYENAPRPAIETVTLRVDLYPSQQSGSIEGTYELINTTDTALAAIPITLIRTDATQLTSLEFSQNGIFRIRDDQIGFYRYALEHPLLPGERISLSYALTFDENEYKDHDFNLELAQNGMILSSFVGEAEYFPQVGYKRELEVQDEAWRAEYGLALQPATMIALADTTQPRRRSRDLIHYEATISTEPDHTAVSTGHLIDSWRTENRNYYRYRTQRPVSGEFGIVSGRYNQYTTTVDGLTVNLFYDEKHPHHLASITEGIIASYKINEANFGSYGHPSINIVEVPGYGVVNGTAISKPTLILWNENGGFTTDVSRTDIDRIYSTAAHEMAHQWWGHQLRPASFTEGQQVLYETIAQYIRLIALEDKYDAVTIQRFLADEQYRYTTGVAQSAEKEPPLVTANAPHLIYHKGTLVMDSLRTLVGAEKLNAVLASFYTDYATAQVPPISTDFVALVRREVADSVSKGAVDLFLHPGW